MNKVQSQYRQTVILQGTYDNIIDQIAKIEAQQERDLSEEIATFENDIRFETVSFSHAGSLVLQELTLQFNKLKTTVLTGPSGSGKTTITDLILGFYAPDAGDVLIDGRPLREFSLGAWRTSIGYVPQEPILFRDTVFTNVELGNRSISEDDVRQALQIAGALECLSKKMPKGIYNDVGEKGAMISGSQRQRIAIARALDFSPELLILNEVTKVLDPDSEQDTVCKILNLMGKIAVSAITQRAAFLEIADRIYHLDAGRIDTQTDNRQKINGAANQRA